LKSKDEQIEELGKDIASTREDVQECKGMLTKARTKSEVLQPQEPQEAAGSRAELEEGLATCFSMLESCEQR